MGVIIQKLSTYEKFQPLFLQVLKKVLIVCTLLYFPPLLLFWRGGFHSFWLLWIQIRRNERGKGQRHIVQGQTTQNPVSNNHLFSCTWVCCWLSVGWSWLGSAEWFCFRLRADWAWLQAVYQFRSIPCVLGQEPTLNEEKIPR